MSELKTYGRSVGIVVALLLIPMIGATAYFTWPRKATPLTEAKAVSKFRKHQASSSTQPRAALLVPDPGVYRYGSSGAESVKLGPLPSEDRTYPSVMTVEIRHANRDSDSCFTSTINMLTQHTEETTYCVDSRGTLRLAGHTKHQTAGAMHPVATMTCDPAIVREAAKATSSLECDLVLSGGPAKFRSTLHATTRSEDSSVRINGEDHRAIAVDVRYEITGDLTGHWNERTWFATENWLPLRIERDLELRGLATFNETSNMQLLDLTPRR